MARRVSWTIQPYGYSVAHHTVWLIVKRGISWSISQRGVTSSVSPREPRHSDFGFQRRRVHLLAELSKNQCCKKNQRQRTSTSGASDNSANSQSKEFEFSDDSNSLSSQMKTSQIQMKTCKKRLKSNMCNLDRWSGQTEFRYHQSNIDGMRTRSLLYY